MRRVVVTGLGLVTLANDENFCTSTKTPFWQSNRPKIFAQTAFLNVAAL